MEVPCRQQQASWRCLWGIQLEQLLSRLSAASASPAQPPFNLFPSPPAPLTPHTHTAPLQLLPPRCSSGFDDLEVPLPAVAQEYVDHGGVVWKVYVAGEQVRGGGVGGCGEWACGVEGGKEGRTCS